MTDFERITVKGNVGRNPNNPIESSPNFITFSVGVDRNYKNPQGEWVKKTNWYGCTTSDYEIAQVIMREVKKGSNVYIEGIPSIKSYKDHQGVIQSSISINIKSMDGIRILTDKQKNNNFVTNQKGYDRMEQPLLDDDIPF